MEFLALQYRNANFINQYVYYSNPCRSTLCTHINFYRGWASINRCYFSYYQYIYKCKGNKRKNTPIILNHTTKTSYNKSVLCITVSFITKFEAVILDSKRTFIERGIIA